MSQTIFLRDSLDALGASLVPIDEFQYPHVSYRAEYKFAVIFWYILFISVGISTAQFANG